MSLKGKPQADPLDQSYLDKIEKYGHAVMSVADRVDEPTGEPNFSYSTGAYESYGAPELIIFGLSSKMHHWMINEFYHRLQKGEQIGTGVEVDGFLEGYPVVFAEAGDKAALEYMNFTRWYYEGETFPVWQMFWPGVNSRKFPWEEDCPQDIIDAQPDLTAQGFANLRKA
jgi:hypothetical protein